MTGAGELWMNADAMATRMCVLTRALPRRILLVDDDHLELGSMADRLASAGFQVTRAMNGEEALDLLSRQWYPLVITDWRLSAMEGPALAKALRGRGLDDTFIIMLTTRDANVDYERGYLAGVDDYLTRQAPEAELFVRIHAAFNTLALRRSLKETQAALEDSVSIDAASGAFAAREVYTKLHSELRRAQRYGRQLAVIAINVVGRDEGQTPPQAKTLRAVVQTIDSAVRAHIDWVGRLDARAGATFVLVLPEAGVAEAPLIKDRVLNALRQYGQSSGEQLAFSVGVAALDRTGAAAQVDAKEMLDVATLCLECPGRAGQEQLRCVQRSVACHVGIVCRHGYAVDSECSLKISGVSAGGVSAGVATA
jgi:two-component system cell cycle response regulator